MPSAPRPAERVMLEVVAHYDPVDYHMLKRLVGERLDGEYNTEQHCTVLKI